MRNFVILTICGFVVSFLFGISEGAIIKSNANKKWAAYPIAVPPIVSCEYGELVGVHEFTEHMTDISNACHHHVPDMKIYYSCLLKTVGSFNGDARPDVSHIEKFYGRMFSSKFFDKIPGLKDGLMACAITYVSAYNGMSVDDAEAGDLAENFVFCFIDEVEKVSEEGDKICEMDDDLL